MVDTHEILLSLHHVSHYYDNGNIRALNNINLAFKKNHCYSIMGESGSGKSSLLNLISGLDIPSTGEILFNNQTVSQKEWTKFRARKIGFVFQSFNLLPTLTAIENIIIPMFGVEKNFHQRRLKAETLLNYVGLKQRASHKPNQLSGGERQRVAIARSLVNSPELLLADEPTGNLDSNTVDSIMELLLKVQRENKMTLVLVTHNTSLAEKMDHIIYLKDGEVISP